MSKRLKQLRRKAEKLGLRVQIAEQRQWLAELRQSSRPLGFYQRKEGITMGGYPSRQTPADKRMSRNNPNAGRGKPAGKGASRPATPPGQVRKAGK